MSEEEQVLWLCSRCAKRTGKKRELEPTVLRVCSVCHVENWVRPVGHAGSDVASPEVEDKAQKAWDEADFLAEHKEGEVAESISDPFPDEYESEEPPQSDTAEEVKAEAEKIVAESNIPEEIKEDIKITVVEPELTEKEKEIARLKAELESLEG